MPVLKPWKLHDRRSNGGSIAAIDLSSALTAVLLGLLTACTKSDQPRAKSAATEQQAARCPQYRGSTHDWRSTQTADGRMILLLPPAYRAVRTDSGQLWADRVASISYRHGGEKIADTTATNRDHDFCTESLGDGAEMRYYHAGAATGEGHYLQVSFSMPDGSILRLIGFSQDSADGTELLAIARSAQTRTP